jgi:hypothetical protein
MNVLLNLRESQNDSEDSKKRLTKDLNFSITSILDQSAKERLQKATKSEDVKQESTKAENISEEESDEDHEDIKVEDDDEEGSEDEAGDVPRVPASSACFSAEALAQQNAALATSLASLVDAGAAHPALFGAHGLLSSAAAAAAVSGLDPSGALIKVPQAHRPVAPPQLPPHSVGASSPHLLAPSGAGPPGLAPHLNAYAPWMMQLPYLQHLPPTLLAARLGAGKYHINLRV